MEEVKVLGGYKHMKKKKKLKYNFSLRSNLYVTFYIKHL